MPASIIIYRSPHSDFLTVAESLKGQGLILGVDWRFENDVKCLKITHINSGEIYTSNDKIAELYSRYPEVKVHRIPCHSTSH